MTDAITEVTLGVDTHKDTHVAAALDQLGRQLGTASFPATEHGYRQLVAWAGGFGSLGRAGVEGTGSWGAGLARYLRAAGVAVIEVNRPNRQRRRRHGKSDTADALSAARAVQAGEATALPRGHDGPIEALRVLRLARRSADRARTQAANQLHAVIDTAPGGLRDELRALPWTQLVARAARLRPGADLADPAAATKRVLRTLALRWQALDAERAQLDADLEAVVAACAPPELLAEFGVGTHTAAALLITAGDHPDRLQRESSFAALCGVSPVDASSGQHQHHRLNRGGDRQANHALWRIVMVRLRWDPTTQAYLARRLSEGKTKREAIRCLKRYTARRLWRILNTHYITTASP